MATDLDPIVGNWYEHVDKGRKFEIVAIDEDTGAVEIQYIDGDVDEVDLDTWYEMELEPSEPPEDWTGPIDDVEEDDLGYQATDMEHSDWVEPLKEKPRPRKRGVLAEEEEEDVEEEWDEGYSEEEPWDRE